MNQAQFIETSLLIIMSISCLMTVLRFIIGVLDRKQEGSKVPCSFYLPFTCMLSSLFLFILTKL